MKNIVTQTLFIFVFSLFNLCYCVLGDSDSFSVRKGNCERVTNSSLNRGTSRKSCYKNRGLNYNIIDVWKNFPINIFTNATGISMKCNKEYQRYISELSMGKLDALKMFDASGKPPSGILRGNVNQYGDFDECMEIKNAQYCLAEVDVSPLWIKPFSEYKDLVHSHFTIKENFDNPGHRVPGFTFVRWGLCIPKKCTKEDLASAFQENLGVKARIRPNLCQSSKNDKINWTFGDYFARIYFALITLLVGIATANYKKICKKVNDNNKCLKILSSFALQRNFSQLMRSSSKGRQFTSVHGVRALSALALLMAHKTMALLYNPYINRTWMTETQSMAWSVIGRNAILYTDCFLLISGLLNSNAMFNDCDIMSRIKFKERFVNRLFRILPSLLTVILFCTYILPSMGSGPLWPLVIDHHSVLCKKYMWRNLFLVHNYFGFENMCLTHTHQVGIDIQLYLVTPIIIYVLWKFENRGLWIVGTIAMFSTLLRFWATFTYHLSYVVHFGIPISRMFDTANLSYILPTHRATIYLIGVALAYKLRKSSKLSKNKHLVMWFLAYIFGITTWFGPAFMSIRTYKYSAFPAAIYSALSPITWGLPVAWVIYAVENGYGSWFTPILNWKYFQVFTRISYGVYLVQFPVFFYNVGITKYVGEFSNYMMLPPVETAVILLISTILTLCVEMPFQNIYLVFK